MSNTYNSNIFCIPAKAWLSIVTRFVLPFRLLKSEKCVNKLVISIKVDPTYNLAISDLRNA